MLKLNWGNLYFTDSSVSSPFEEKAQGEEQNISLLFLEGTGCDSHDWDETIRALSNNTRAITMDFRGHGKSDTPNRPMSLHDLALDTIALITHLELEHVILVGHSLGGMVAMDAAPLSPAIAALVLLEGWTNLRAASAFGNDRMYGHLSDEHINNIKAKDAAMRARFDPYDWRAVWITCEAFDATDYLHTAAIPIYEVYGDLGRTDATLGRLSIPDRSNIETIWIPGSGHYLPHEKPAEVADICDTVVRRIGVQAQ